MPISLPMVRVVLEYSDKPKSPRLDPRNAGGQ